MCGKPALGGKTHPRCRTLYGLDGLYASAHYSGPVKQAIHLLKYRLVRDLTRFTVNELFTKIPPELPRFDYIVPVPLHAKRLRLRGFNQSVLIASYLSETFRVGVVDGILVRKAHTRPQAELKREDRLENIHHAFSCSDPSEIRGKTIALVDDVATTCATLRECAHVLKRAGAKSVWGIVLAHG